MSAIGRAHRTEPKEMVPRGADLGSRLQHAGALESDAQFPVESSVLDLGQFRAGDDDFAISASRLVLGWTANESFDPFQCDRTRPRIRAVAHEIDVRDETAMKTTAVRVVLADMSRLTRELILRIVEAEPGVTVVARVPDHVYSLRALVAETRGHRHPRYRRTGLLAECAELLDELALRRVLAVSADGRRAHLYGPDSDDLRIDELSLSSSSGSFADRNPRHGGFVRAGRSPTMIRSIVGMSLRFGLLMVALAAAYLPWAPRSFARCRWTCSRSSRRRQSRFRPKHSVCPPTRSSS